MSHPVRSAKSATASRTTPALPPAEQEHPFPIGDLAPVTGNLRAIEVASSFARATQNYVVLVGPTGWGKSHLLQSTALGVGLYQGHSIRVQDARRWALEGSDCLEAKPLILDDVQDALGSPRARHALANSLERRAKIGRPTMLGFGADTPQPSLHQVLPTNRPWVMATIREPDASGREAVVWKIARKEGVKLSRVACRLTARMVSGNAYSISGALRRAKLDHDDWSDPAQASALCGVLLPHRCDADDWDPRDTVADVVAATLLKGPYAKLAKEITAYFLCREVGMSESGVAAYLQLPPGEVYGWVRLVDSQSHEPGLSQQILACKNALLQTLSHL